MFKVSDLTALFLRHSHAGFILRLFLLVLMTGALVGCGGDGGSGKGASPSPRKDKPEAPVKLMPTAGDGQVTLTWEVPSGSSVTSYKYRVRESGREVVGWTTIPNSNANTRSYTVTNLTNGVTYTFDLRAVNQAGESDLVSIEGTPNGAITPVPGADVPDVPRSFTATAGDAQVTLEWQAPTSDGGSSITSYKYRVSQTGTNTWAPDWTTVTGGASARSQTVTGLTNGTSYTFELRAVNGVGESSEVNATATPVAGTTVPGPPRSFTATVGDTQVVLNWQAPSSDGGSSIIHYSYRVSQTGTNTWSPDWTTVTGGASASSQTVTGLTNGTNYTFELRAVNGEGESVKVSDTATPATTPGSPRSFTATVGDTQVVLSWQAPSSDGGDPITSYSYRVSQAGTNTWSPDWTTVTGGASASSQTVTGLTNGTSYTFELRAVNGVGESSEVNATATPVAGTTVPGPPRSFTATVGDTQVVLNWQAPSSDGGDPITSYSYRVSQTGTNTWSPDWTDVTGGGSARSQTVTGLTNGTNYTFELRAVNGEGESVKVSDTATPATTPGSPRNFTATVGNAQVVLNWEAPTSDGGSSITGYKYRVSQTGTNTWSPDWTDVSGGASASSQTVTGLTNGTSYTFELRAVNGAGESVEVSATATPVTVPGPPRNFAATMGDTQVVLNWEAPTSDGGSPITSYRYRMSQTGTNTWSPDWTDVTGGGSARSQTVTSLTNGTNYTFELKAVSGVGESSSVSDTATPSICGGAVDGTLDGSGTSGDPYIVCSSNHLGLIGSGSYNSFSHYKMGQDIDLNNVAFTPIGTFIGTFDGDGKKIQNLSISRSGSGISLSVGLFQVSAGTIKNLGIENFNITASAGSSTSLSIGALVGSIIGGTVSNCYAVGFR